MCPLPFSQAVLSVVNLRSKESQQQSFQGLHHMRCLDDWSVVIQLLGVSLLRKWNEAGCLPSCDRDPPETQAQAEDMLERLKYTPAQQVPVH